MPKNTGLKLFTKTWPPKKDTKEERPLTATLDKPTVLNVSLVGIIDMSCVRKEFLNIRNLCRFPICLSVSRRQKPAVNNRPLSLPASNNVKLEKHRDSKKISDTISLEKKGNVRSANNAEGRNCNVSKKGVTEKKDKYQIKRSPSDGNNNKVLKIPIPRRGGNNNVMKMFKPTTNLDKSSNSLPEPCRTCGRPDQPERFHSHPTTPLKFNNKKNSDEIIPQRKNSVQKPVAINYKSKQSVERKELQTPQKPSLPNKRLVDPVVMVDETAKKQTTASLRIKPEKRMPICSICNREFGTASLPLHERKCLQSKLTVDQIQTVESPPTTRPTMPPPSIECYICGKKFGTHSIKIHQSRCLKKWNQENDSPPPNGQPPSPTRKESLKVESPLPQDINKEQRPSSSKKSPMFPCYICGRLFTVNSIYIHEPQCLKMWKIENDKLPVNRRKPQPLKPDVKFTPTGDVDFVGTFHRIWDNHLAGLIECRKCGRKFFPDRIEKHEAACIGQKVQLKTNKKLQES